MALADCGWQTPMLCRRLAAVVELIPFALGHSGRPRRDGCVQRVKFPGGENSRAGFASLSALLCFDNSCWSIRLAISFLHTSVPGLLA